MTISAGQPIDFAAAKKIVIKTAAGATIEIGSNGINVTAPGQFTVHAAQHQFVGRGGTSYTLPVMPKAEWLNKESIRFCLEGSDELAVDMGLVNQPFKILDSEGAVLAQGTIPKDGRLPRVMTDKNKTARIEIGKNKWQKYSAGPTSSEPEEDVLSKETVPVANDPYIGLLKQDTNEARLSKKQLIDLVGDVQGEA